MVDARCPWCEHRKRCNDFEPKTVCTYLLDTGRRRPPLEDGKCPVYKTKRKQARGIPGVNF